MNRNEILDLIGEAREEYIREARAGTMRRSSRRLWLVAAAVAAALLLVGCTVAYVNGWFPGFFAERGGAPLSDSQIGYIQEKEAIRQEAKSEDGWTVELKSTLSDGDILYAIFAVTAPETVDLEGINLETPGDGDSIIPGNSGMTREGKEFFRTSLDRTDVCWQLTDGWKADNDGRRNTLYYAVEARWEAEKSVESAEITICFDKFVHSWEDPEVRRAIDEKYAGQDYLIAGEELEGLYRSEVLAEGEWEFTVAFEGGRESESLELVGDYAMTWAQVSWKLDDDPLTYETGSGIAPVKITSFRLDPLGAEVTYEFEEPMFSAFIEYQDNYGYEDRSVYAVMKDGSRIALRTHGSGDKLRSDTPIVLAELDYVLLGDGGKLTADGEWIEPEF